RSRLLTSRNNRFLAESEFATRMVGNPVLQNATQQRRHWDAPCGPFVMSLLPLVNRDDVGLEVDVRNPRSDNLGAASTRVSGKNEERIKERLASHRLHVLQQILDVGQRQKDALPQFGSLLSW